MYKTIAISFLCLLTYSCFAQKDDDKDRHLLPNGLRGGYQWSNLENDSESAADNLDGFYVGYVRKIKLIPLIHIETGLEYMLAGAKQTDNSKLQIHYIVLPAQGVLKIGPFVGMAGVNANFKVGEKLTVNGQTVDRDDKAAVFDFAVDGGLGFNILMFTIEARYYWGLIEVENGWYNRYAQLGLKLHF